MKILLFIRGYIIKACAVMLVFLYCQNTLAQSTQPCIKSLSGADGSLAVDSNRTVEDSVYFNKSMFPAFDTTVSISNIITLYVDENSTLMPPDSFRLSVDVNLYFYNKDSIYDSVTNKTLLVEYNKARTYTNKAVYYFRGAHRVKMKVTGITPGYVALGTALPFVKLENRMVIDRIFTLDCSNTAVKTIAYDDQYINTKGELMVSWAELNGAQEYDLEWTFIDQTALDAGWYNKEGVLDPELVFADNATRVTIAGTGYFIPLLYEGDGQLFFRVRAAQTTIGGERKATHWSSDFIPDGGLGQYSFAGHERTLNWQASTSFAEGGKRKSVVQYFDGTLRNRQTVTKDNTTDSTLTAETFYDKQGRGVIQVLPAPTLSAIIKYTPQFNKAPGGVEYSKDRYDTLYTAADYCAESAPLLDSSSGASKYYSYNNPNKLIAFNRFIPRALGYPFTEVKYTQDNTGRIASQGGVGPQFQLNSGHETKYYYGTPEQSDLDALFGTEAGYAAHYQKNMVRDANGQYSVSYVDMHGRTVATALAGQAPASLQSLDSYAYFTRTDSLVGKSNNLIKGNTIESASSLLVTMNGDVTFRYALNPESLTLPDKDNVDVCYDCLYDLTITVTDDCNNQSLPSGRPFVFRDSNMRVLPPVYDTTCNNEATAFTVTKDTFTLTLTEGSYMVTKKLTLREDARDWYRDSLYAPHNTVKTKQDIINDQLALIRQQREGDCVQESEPSYLYDQHREQMLLDMTPPFGQYADYPIPKDNSRLNIFNRAGKMPPVDIYQTVFYPHDSDKPDPGGYTREAFVNNFQPEWAEALLKLHPEYEKLQAYERYIPSFHWDDGFEQTDTYAAALPKGYLNPTNSSLSPASLFGNGNDSMFYGGTGPSAAIWDSLIHYKTLQDGNTYSLWAVASIMAHCDLSDAACLNGFRTTPSSVFGSAMCDGEKNMAWRFFRDEYLRIKRNWITNTVKGSVTVVLDSSAVPVFFSQDDMANKSGVFLGTDSAAAVKAGADSMTIISNRNCIEYTKRWWQQRAPCNYTAEDSLIIVPRLIEVCSEGSDYTHPYGASSVAPGSHYTYRSFDEVISQYNNSKGLSNSPACNAYLIDAPGPYNKPFAVISQPTYNRPDSCTCDKISALYTKYQGTTGYSDFSDYIQQTLHATISQADLDSLRDLCNGTGCRFKVNPITIPSALQCSTGYDVCVDCNQVNAVYNNFKAAFPGSIPSYTDTSELQQQTNQLFRHYMNDKLGFSKASYEYLAFMDSCGISFAYDSLRAIVKKYNLESNPLRVRIANQSNGLNPPVYLTDLNQILEEGTIRWPKAIRDTTGKGWVYFQETSPGIPFCMTNGYSVEFRFKSLKKMSTADDYFYMQGGNINFVLYRRETGTTPGFFLRSISAIGGGEGEYVFDSLALMDSDPDIMFKQWTVIKVAVTTTHFRIYYNGSLVKEVARPVGRPLVNATGIAYCFYDYQATIDWMKLYDANDRLVYFNDFDDPTTLTIADPSFTCPSQESSCQTGFTNYFNTRKGTSYTFSQIDSIYFAVGGKHLDVCGTGIYGGANTLSDIVDSFYVNAKPGRVDHSITPQAASPLHDLKQIVRNGLVVLPDSIRSLPGSDYNRYQLYFDKFCTSAGYTVASKFRFLNDSLSGDAFYLDYGNMVPLFYKDTNGKLYLEKVTLKGASVDTINLSVLIDSNAHALLDYMTVKGIVKPSKYELYYNNRLIFEHSRNPADTIANKESFVWGLRGRHGAIDWIRIGDANDSTKYFEDFDNISRPATVDTSFICTSYTPCRQAFESYYNTREGTSYTYSQLDSVYTAGGMVLDACPIDTVAIRCDQLEKYAGDYKSQYIAPSSGYVDLDMRTFAGNKTPDEGPKGVFDVNGRLLGNTVDSTPTAVKQSYVHIWNNSADNRAIGTLSLLENGRFRLMLNAGKQVPPQGIIGQRYYQVDAYTNLLDGILTGTGTYIDFGDSTGTKVNDLDSSTSTVTVSLSASAAFTVYPDPKIVYTYYTKHNYTNNPTFKTVTIYHSDFKGNIAFDCFAPDNCAIYSNIRNIRGYFPQDLRSIYFHTTHDSTLNNFSNIRNFSQINSITDFSFAGHTSTGFRNNRLLSFSNNHDMRQIDIDNDPGVPVSQTKPISEYFPDLPNNFPNLASIIIRPFDTSFTKNLDFTIPGIRFLWIQNEYVSSSSVLSTQKIDEIINQVAAGAVNDSGALVILPYGGTLRSSASDAAVAALTVKKWYLSGAGMDNNVPNATYTTPVVPDTLLWFSSFTDFINGKLNTQLTAAQINSLYLSKCGHLPDCCSAPDASLPTTLMLCGKNEPPPAYTLEQVYDPPCSDSSTLANNTGEEIYTLYKDSLDQSFNQKYTAKCLGAASIESLIVEHKVSEYHYTLYYYDQAGNLVKTIPPAGVNPNRDSAWLADVRAKRKAGVPSVPSHTLPTIYRYNSLNQVVSQSTADAGRTTNWYDKLGRLAVSQNAKQLAEHKYSYTLYDQLGRITEVGQKYQTTAMTNIISRDTAALAGWIYYNDGSNHYPAEMVTQTVYDIPGVDATICPTGLRFVQKSYTLRNRVSYTRYYEKPSYYYDAGAARYYISGATYTTGIDYSYDIHGNVDSMRNLYNAITYSPITYHGYNSCKTIVYKYDLISSKVNEVHYNPGENDEFYHRYEYDAENRLTDVYTTDTKAFIGQPGLEEHDAKYQYYQHGPLARMQAGQQVVQGVDYAYTLQGWLKGINNTAQSTSWDMGGDGVGANIYNASDGYGYTLYYFNGDYGAINYNLRPFAEPQAYFPSGEYRPLYNGNISSTAHNIGARFYAQLYNYSYDQLNRLKAMDMYRGLNSTTNQWSSLALNDLYKERYSYDANGNITYALRNGNLTANPLMDNLYYAYKPGTNQLDHIRDTTGIGVTSHSSNYGAIVDIKDQSSGNYVYNAIGELNYDRISSIDSIKWNVYGKMQHIYKHSAAYGTEATGLHYHYDPSGNRTGMAVLYDPSSAYNVYTWYVRDAQGNVMAVYKANGSNLATITLKLKEHYMYGSSRLGVINRDMDVDQPRLTPDNGNANLGTAYLATFTRGDKLFEFTNHLGNVLFTATDSKVPRAQTGNPSLVGSYSVNMVTAVDYTPFGMIMQGMNYNGAVPGKYRYGFNGKEWENSTKGNADQIDYGERMYDNRVGRFLSVDPLTKQYPWLSPYQYAENSPIANIDIDGLEKSYAADGRVLFGPLARDPLTGGRVYASPPPGTLAYTFDQSKNTPKQPVARPQPSRQDNLSLPSNVRNATVHGEASRRAYEESTRRFNPENLPSNKAQIKSPDPFAGYSDFERGMITSPTTQAAALTVCPGCAVGIGGLQTYSGIQSGNPWEAGAGVLTMIGGGIGLYGKFAPGSAGSQLAEMEAASGGHFLSRHGAQTSLSSQYLRAVSGMTPEGVVMGEVNASRFFSNEIQLEAAKMAQARFANTGEKAFTFDMGKLAGEGYIKGGGAGSFRTTTEVRAVFKDGQLNTLYPLLKQ